MRLELEVGSGWKNADDMVVQTVKELEEVRRCGRWLVCWSSSYASCALRVVLGDQGVTIQRIDHVKTEGTHGTEPIVVYHPVIIMLWTSTVIQQRILPSTL